jgi:hypothetical protein
MPVEIHSPDLNRLPGIETAAQKEWPFKEWDWLETLKLLSSYAEGSLCGGENKKEFVDRITKAIWKANGGYCKVLVSTTCLEDIPTDDYELAEDDFVRWSKAESMSIIADTPEKDISLLTSEGGNYHGTLIPTLSFQQ